MSCFLSFFSWVKGLLMDVGGRILHFVGFVVACMDCHREKKGRKLRREGVKDGSIEMD